MTHFQFWDDPYLAELDTTVLSVEGNAVILKETIAYAEAGGQESDLVKINDITALESTLDPEKRFITYILPENHGLQPGTSAHTEIDWIRRYRLMRLHFACELILILMNRHFGKKKEGEELLPEEIDHLGIEKVGAHMSEDKARIDFVLSENIETYFPMLLSEFKKIIDADVPIEKGYLNSEKRQRYWRIEGLATVPCGGTHVKSTSEVGYVNLRRKRANKGVERIYITLENP
ncbi:MAG: alanyl-tRNA editing protein [Chlamydiae bacterium]|nr:alanyl-tRNA editing protein [Chlamydiota bacterium]